MLSPKTLNQIFKRLQEHLGEANTELEYNSTFELLIAVILSAQATDVSVNKATRVLFKQANTPAQILALGSENLKKYIKTIGLYNTKANNIIKTCKILVSKYTSIVPDTRAELESLPGVGRKTANVILNQAFGKPTIAVDTHVLRVANRLGLANSSSALKVEQQLEQVVPQKFKAIAHGVLILHGRYTCVARKPKCEQCVIMQYCAYAKNMAK